MPRYPLIANTFIKPLLAVLPYNKRSSVDMKNTTTVSMNIVTDLEKSLFSF